MTNTPDYRLLLIQMLKDNPNLVIQIRKDMASKKKDASQRAEHISTIILTATITFGITSLLMIHFFQTFLAQI